ncbi:MSHA biogenesis protein MshI [Vibrio sp. DW001]|uniref:MSHA biogenesis protein MshI n=1 Tax=Vibrio sp. DW001 TaxID=2912315 RepID=UPI0023B14D6D|nr:MSHA biogenesis protein MshI [Vibrio sp. DW001]WED26403.1 MSHA biogenesis protein MshI [Vibrio sp. DW001]
MNVRSLFSKLTSSSNNKDRLRIVIQVDAIYIRSSDKANEETLLFPIESSWDAALKVALSSFTSNKYSATVVFSSNYYQIYQIDKPELPKDEWSVALPFLLKDLVNERVTDIVADASLLPDGRRAQAYVLSKKYLTPLIGILDNANIALSRIVPEDEVWGYVQSDVDNFMLLYRGMKDSYKISAFVETKNRFQRVIRGVVPPLTGVASSELQLDSIALELQRSIDYLSSQLRDAALNHLLVLCDEDNTEELVSALSERLSAQVSALNMADQLSCGQVLCNTLPLIPDDGINLYPAHLKPKKERFTLKAVFSSWLLLSLVMGGYYGYMNYELAEIDQALTVKTRNKERLADEFETLSYQVANHKPNPAKLKAIDRLTVDIDAKKATLKAINQFDDSLKEGYSGVMASLSELGRDDISISHIELNEKILNLKGLARTPSSVPKWVKQFKTELNLIGRTFESLNIGRNEEDIVTFELVTQVESKNALSVGEE